MRWSTREVRATVSSSIVYARNPTLADAPDQTPQTAQENLIGRTFDGRYRIEALVGRGGMGEVYKARQLTLDQDIALKVLWRHLSEDEHQVKRFNHEAFISSKLKHPNSIRVFDFGQSEDGYLFLAMELLDGEELSEIIRRDAPMDPQRAGHIIRQMLKSLGEAHDLGLIHRDLKPDNVILCQFHGEPDFVKILDFGIAKFLEDPDSVEETTPGMVCGTPLYIAPEQALGETVTQQADLYTLGVLFYEMLTGKVPFRGDTQLTTVMKHIHDAPPPFAEIQGDIEVDEEVEALVMRLLEKDPADRFVNADAVSVELDRLLPVGGVSSTTLSLGGQDGHGALGRSASGRGSGTSAWLGMLAAVAATVAMLLWLDVVPGWQVVPENRAPPHRRRARAAVVQPIPTPGPPSPSAPDPGVTIEVASDPQGALVILAGEPVGETPMTMTGPAGSQRGVLLRKEGYLDTQARIIFVLPELEGEVPTVTTPLRKPKRQIRKPRPTETAPKPLVPAPPPKKEGLKWRDF
jgi:tRNA A-37 threonylcarbamoyl transferase component Bud32